MFTQDRSQLSNKEIIDFYSKLLKEHGNSSKGVGWKNDMAQSIRFRQLIKVIEETKDFSVNDFGCGMGQLYYFLLAENFSEITYNGYDILEEMIAVAHDNLKFYEGVRLKKIESVFDLDAADYTIASGVFNVKNQATDQEWLKHVLLIIDTFYQRSKRGFAFNFLTSYSDKEFMKSYLFYADPLLMFDYCKRNFSKNVALLHDYNQHDFTVVVRKTN